MENVYISLIVTQGGKPCTFPETGLHCDLKIRFVLNFAKYISIQFHLLDLMTHSIYSLLWLDKQSTWVENCVSRGIHTSRGSVDNNVVHIELMTGTSLSKRHIYRTLINSFYLIFTTKILDSLYWISRHYRHKNFL